MESNKDANNSGLFKSAIAGAVIGAAATRGHSSVKNLAKSANVSTKDMYKRMGSNLKKSYKDVGKVLDEGASNVLKTTKDAGSFIVNGAGNLPLSHMGKEISGAYNSDIYGLKSGLKDILVKEL